MSPTTNKHLKIATNSPGKSLLIKKSYVSSNVLIKKFSKKKEHKTILSQSLVLRLSGMVLIRLSPAYNLEEMYT